MVNLDSSLLIINSRGDLLREIQEHKILASFHLLLLCPFQEVKDLIEDISRENFAYSVISLADSPALRESANQIDTIPFFIEASLNNAEKTAERLRQHPHREVSRAINGIAVSLRYLEGSPS